MTQPHLTTTGLNYLKPKPLWPSAHPNPLKEIFDGLFFDHFIFDSNSDFLSIRTVESGASKNGSSSGEENAADQFAKSDRNTLKKIRNEAAAGAAAAEVPEIAAVRRTAIQAKGRVPTPKHSTSETTQK